MKASLFFTCIFFFSLSLIAQQTINDSIEHDGLERTYILYVPDSYVAGNPLVMNFHGYTSSAFEQLNYGDFRPFADSAGFLLVVPQGTIDITGEAHWNVGWGSSSVDDVGFVSALIDSLHAAYSVDLDRVYGTGMSNGGFLSYRLACELSERIAAIASVTGTMNIGTFNTCAPQRPVPVMEIHGTNDGTVAYEGAFWIEGTEDVVAYWAEHNNAEAIPTITPIPDTDMTDGCTAEHWVFANGDLGSSVELYKIIDGGHTWPGAVFNVGVTNQDFDATTEIWRFFSGYDLQGAITPTSIQEYAAHDEGIDLIVNVPQRRIELAESSTSRMYSVVDSAGRLCLSSTLNPGQAMISLQSIPDGVYILVIDDSRQRFILR